MREKFCMACMDGDYPTGDVTPQVLRSIEAERAAEARRLEGVPVPGPGTGAGEGPEVAEAGAASATAALPARRPR